MCWLSKLFTKQNPIPPAAMTKSEVIEKLEWDIVVHENWACYVTEYPEYAPTMGDYDWHLEWINSIKMLYII